MKKLEEMTIAEVLALDLPPLPADHRAPEWDATYTRREAITTAKEEAEDELAYARVLARRQRRPDADWPLDASDPRRAEWIEAVWDRLYAIVEHVKLANNVNDISAGRARNVRHELRRANELSRLLLEELAAIEAAPPSTGRVLVEVGSSPNGVADHDCTHMGDCK